MKRRQKRMDLHMAQETNSAKSKEKTATKCSCPPPPSCRQLAERFMELQRLRMKVRAAEFELRAGDVDTHARLKTSGE